MLELSYRNDLQLVQVSLAEEKHLWPIIRTIFEENAEEIVYSSSYCLRLPVWAFLSCREGIRYFLKKYAVQITVDAEIRDILTKSLSHQDDYSKANNPQLISSEELITRLEQSGFVRKLTTQQERNVIKLVSLPSGATFSVPGAGKTTEALAYFYFKKAPEDKLLVVCPKNAFAAWEEQVSICIKHSPDIIRLVGGEKSIRKSLKNPPSIALITYQQLTNIKSLIASFLQNTSVFMFLDESHRIKRGNEGQWCSAILNLAHLPTSKLIMSGTPLPNSISDIIPQFNFLYPEIDADQENIKSLIRPVFVRTTKKELSLPKIIRIETIIQLQPQQRHLYELLRSEEARKLSSFNIKDRSKLRHISRSVMRLLQLTSNPALLLKNSVDLPDELYNALAEGDNAKIEYACYKARKLAQEGKKVLIWSNFVENVETIALRLSDIGADYIHGGVEAGSEEEENTRESKIAKFHNSSQASVLVANPAACAEGISLHTVCHHAIYIDRNYNAAQYLQSEDRIHRLGLPPDVITTIEILFTPDTIDESVKRRLNFKVKKMAEILDDNSLNIEVVEPDLDVEGLTEDDINDFLMHLKGE
jgi:SNF2 family DNA or RNA helicase